jgi:triphosphoribosyl-dephospho-CoA synthase
VSSQEKAQHISKCLQLAILLEVSSEKPGNVNLTSSFEGTTCQHFLASAVAAGPAFQEAAYRGSQVTESKVGIDKVGLGQLIKTCTSDVNAWQRGGNTILGTIMLLVPIAAASGMTPAKKDFSLDLLEMRKNIEKLVSASTALDSVHLYEAIAIANPSGLNKSADFDVNDPASKQRLIQENVTLLQVFKIGADYDDISNEWVTNFSVTFDSGYPFLKEQLKTKPLNTAIVHTFLKILSERPDTFIARKVGRQKAIEVSADAKAVLDLGGLETEKGTKSLREFDRRFRQSQNKCNPGTTADLTAAALALCTLSGYRP